MRSAPSTLDATGGGTLTPAAASNLTVRGQGDVQFFGLVRTQDAGSEIQLTAAGQVLAGGLIRADRLLAIHGGTDSSGVGIFVPPLILNPQGQRACRAAICRPRPAGGSHSTPWTASRCKAPSAA